MTLPWLFLVLAGLLEIVWAVGLKSTDGFTRLWPTLFVGAAIVTSLYFLALAQRTLPIAVAYAVWMGIGTLGTALVTSVWLKVPITPAQWGFIVLLLVAVAGLKITS